MDTKKNLSREQLLAYMQDACTAEQAQQIRMWLRERLNDPALDQLFSDLLDAVEIEYDPEGKERIRRRLDSIISVCPALNSPPPQKSGPVVEVAAPNSRIRGRHRGRRPGLSLQA